MNCIMRLVKIRRILKLGLSISGFSHGLIESRFPATKPTILDISRQPPLSGAHPLACECEFEGKSGFSKIASLTLYEKWVLLA